MKKRILLLIVACLSLKNAALAQTTAFTYQGRLTDNGVTANGSYDLCFKLFNAANGGNQLGGVITNSATQLSNGLFAVTLDFGSVFDGNARWVEISVRTNGGGGFIELGPRQQLNAAPYAITAGNISGAVAAGQLTGTLPAGALEGDYTSTVNFVNANNSFVASNVFAGSLNLNTTLQFGTNAGYVAIFPSVSGLLGQTNLGFNFNRSATVWDMDKPPDEVMMWGYNISPGGGLADSHDTALGFSLEGNYNTLGNEFTEAHLHYVDISGTQRRPWSWRIDKSTDYWDWQNIIHASKVSVLPPDTDTEYLSLSANQFIYRIGPGFTNGIQIYPIGGSSAGVQLNPFGGGIAPRLDLSSWDQILTPVGVLKSSGFDIYTSVFVVNSSLALQDLSANNVVGMDTAGVALVPGKSINFVTGPDVRTSATARITSLTAGTVSVSPNLAVENRAEFGGPVAYSFSAQSPASSPSMFVADFAKNYRTITATNDVNFAYATNLPTSGTNVLWSVIKVVATGANRTFSAPTNWHWMSLGDLTPAGGVYTGTIPNGKRAWLSLYADGALQDDVTASWTLEP